MPSPMSAPPFAALLRPQGKPLAFLRAGLGDEAVHDGQQTAQTDAPSQTRRNETDLTLRKALPQRGYTAHRRQHAHTAKRGVHRQPREALRPPTRRQRQRRRRGAIGEPRQHDGAMQRLGDIRREKTLRHDARCLHGHGAQQQANDEPAQRRVLRGGCVRRRAGCFPHAGRHRRQTQHRQRNARQDDDGTRRIGHPKAHPCNEPRAHRRRHEAAAGGDGLQVGKDAAAHVGRRHAHGVDLRGGQEARQPALHRARQQHAGRRVRIDRPQLGHRQRDQRPQDHRFGAHAVRQPAPPWRREERGGHRRKVRGAGHPRERHVWHRCQLAQEKRPERAGHLHRTHRQRLNDEQPANGPAPRVGTHGRTHAVATAANGFGSAACMSSDWSRRRMRTKVLNVHGASSSA